MCFASFFMKNVIICITFMKNDAICSDPHGEGGAHAAEPNAAHGREEEARSPGDLRSVGLWKIQKRRHIAKFRRYVVFLNPV